MTPLHVAAYFGCATIVGILVKEGHADIDAQCGEFDGGSALHLAASGNDMISSHQYLQLLIRLIACRGCSTRDPHAAITGG